MGRSCAKKGVCSKLKCDGTFSECRHLGVRVPYRPMTSYALQREITSRYFSGRQKLRYDDLFGNAIKTNTQRRLYGGNNRTMYTGVMLFCGYTGVAGKVSQSWRGATRDGESLSGDLSIERNGRSMKIRDDIGHDLVGYGTELHHGSSHPAIYLGQTQTY